MSDSNFRRFTPGTQLVPQTSSNVSQQGDMDVDTTSTKINYHNGTTSSPVVTETHASQGANRLTNKDLDDASTKIVDTSDTTKKIAFDAAGTTGTTTTITSSQTTNRTLTLPDVTDTLVGKTTTDVLTNKSLSDSTTAIVDVGDNTKQIKFDAAGTTGTSTTLTSSQTTNKVLTLPDATDTLVGKATTDTLTNKTLIDTSTAIADVGDNTKQIKFDAAGTTATSTTLLSSQTTNKTLTLPDVTDTLVARTTTDTLTNKSLSDSTTAIVDNSDATKKILFDAAGTTATTTTLTSSQTTNKVLTLPDATDTLVGKATTDTFTNKTPGQNWIPDANTRDLGSSTTGWNNEYLVGFSDRGQIATPATPAASHDRMYFKSDDNLYSLDSSGNEKLIGSGASLSTNFVGLNTAFQPVNTNDTNAEATTGNWATYADAAGTVPVDMTGGSATQLTFSRTTTAGEVLNGAGSFKIVKAAANAQGQGVSCVANVPVGYRGQTASITMPFKIISGTLVSGDLLFFVYDVTNSALITPYNNTVLISQSVLTMTWNVPTTCAQIRIGFFFATTVTTAVTFSWDDVYTGPQQISTGPAMSDWQQYTLTVGATTTPPTKGTVVSDVAEWRRVGSDMELRWDYAQSAAGSNGSGVYLFPIPTGYTIDTTKIAADTNGALGYCGVSGASNAAQPRTNGVMIVYNTTNLAMYVSQDGATTTSTGVGSAQVGLGSTTIRYTFTAKVPILTWSSNVITSNSQVFTIGPILANGTRVTTTPTALGQYRTLIKDVNATTSTDNAPTTGPSAADGMRIFTQPFNAAGTSGQPNKWVIFVGKNKTVRFQPYTTTGRTGQISTDYYSDGSTSSYGIKVDYDPTTGNAVIDTMPQNGGVTSTFIGVTSTEGTGAQTKPTDCYFDIVVSENALSVSTGAIVTTTSLANVKIATAYITNNGTASITRQDGSWLSSVTRNGTGDVTLNIAAGTFTVAPNVTVSSVASSTFANISTAPSTSAVRVTVFTDAGAGSDRDFMVIAVGVP